MKISNTGSLAFTSIPLYDVKLRKPLPDGTYKEVDAQFSKLDSMDDNDISRAEKIYEKWKYAPFGVSAAGDFLMSDKDRNFKNFDFYVIEEKGKKGNREIYSIAEFDKSNKFVELLQANPTNRKKKIQGAGEVMLWGIAKENKPDDSQYVFYLEPASGAVGFYSKIGLDTSSMFFKLSAENRNEFLDKIKKKYNFDVVA